MVRGIHVESLGFQVQRCLLYFFRVICFFLAVLSLRCWPHFSRVAVGGLLTGAASLVAESTGLGIRASVAVTHGPSCSVACGIFPGQGSNLWPPNWQADPQPLAHQGRSPRVASWYAHDFGQVFLPSSPHPSQYCWLDTHFGFEK